MKKALLFIFIVVILIAVVFLTIYFIPDKSLTGDPPVANGEYFFTARITEVHDNYLLVEVTDGGNSHISVGSPVTVTKNVTSADGCPSLTVGEYARVVFDGTVMEKYPPSLGTVYRIYKTDASGKSIAD